MQIGPYQLEGELGRGGMGVVYAATDLRSGAKVALKLLLSTREATPAARRRQEIELQTLSRLPPHPHLVRLLDAGAHQGAHYTVSELVAGDTLEDRLRAGPLPVADALRLARELAQALIAVHAQGVLHRDLKPDNVLLRASDGAALLTDFGLALDLEATYTRVTRSHALMGTPGYWAPEQALGETRAVGPATDVYGLGAVLYAALTGRPPIQAETLVLFLDAAREGRVEPPQRVREEVPAWLGQVCLGALQSRPQDRYPSIAAFAEALEREPSPSPSRARGPLLALGALGLAVAGGGVLLFAGAGAQVSSSAPTPAPSARPSAAPAQPSGPELERLAQLATQAGRHEEAERLLSRAAELGHVPALLTLGQQAFASGTAAGYARAAELFERAAQAGDLVGMTRLARQLRSGQGVKADLPAAYRWNLLAAEAGDPEGMVQAGLQLAQAQGVSEDDEAAIRWLEQGLATVVDGEGWYHLGRLYNAPGGASRDPKRAAECFAKAAALDEPNSLFLLGFPKLTGRQGRRAIPAGLELVRRAAERGHQEAMYNLGSAYEQGVLGQRDLSEAARWYRLAAEAGSEHGMYNLGVLLFNGQGVARDREAGVAWYRRAAELGKVEAMVNLGYVLENGLGAARDPAQAAQWYRKALESNPQGRMRLVAQQGLARLGR